MTRYGRAKVVGAELDIPQPLHTDYITVQPVFVNGFVGMGFPYIKPAPTKQTHYYNKHLGYFVEREKVVD